MNILWFEHVTLKKHIKIHVKTADAYISHVPFKRFEHANISLLRCILAEDMCGNPKRQFHTKYFAYFFYRRAPPSFLTQPRCFIIWLH